MRKAASVASSQQAKRCPGKDAHLALCLVLAGCTVGPDFERPKPPAVTTYTKQPLLETSAPSSSGPDASQQIVPDQDIPGSWWSLFHSSALDTLIKQALTNSPDLQSAQAALRVAMENVKAQNGLFYPTVGVSANASRNKNPGQLSPVLASSVLLYNLYQTQLSVSWSPDIWGGNRRQVEALQAAADAQKFQLRSTYVTLTSNIVAAAVQEASLREQIATTNEIIAAERQILNIERHQKDLGQISGADVAAQETLLAQTEQTLPPLQKQLSVQRDQLTALAGRLPVDEIAQTFALSSLTLPHDLPVSLPSNLVEHRPDVRVAEENLHTASALVGVAIANRLPNFTLAANDGSVATKLGDLFSSGNGFWSVGAGVTEPLFDGGTLLHRSRAARAAYDQAASQYRSTVIAAFQNVADVLHAIQTDREALAAAKAAESAATRSFNIADEQVKLGQSSRLALLNAEQARLQTRIVVVQAEANRLADTAALFQALGGGWWNDVNLASKTAPE